MADHANLSPSGSVRWTACPGSIRMEASAPPAPQSDAAAEGTAAHAVLEWCLLNGRHPHDYPNEYCMGYEVNAEMRHACAVHYEWVQTYAAAYPGCKVLIEQRVNPGMAMGRTDCWGTADTIILNGWEELIVADFKYGKGLVVEVEENTQAELYGIGAMARFNWDVDTFIPVIIQPRAPHTDGPIRVGSPIKSKQLRKRLDFYIDAALATDDPDAPLIPGDKQCRFCRASGTCPALTEHSLSVAQQEFTPIDTETQIHPKPADELTDDQLAYVLDNASLIDSWLRSVQNYAQAKLERGDTVPGYKLVRKRSNRKWLDITDIGDQLVALGLPADEIFEKKLISPARVEQIAKVTLPMAMRKELKNFVVKPPGGLTIAPEDDKREAVRPVELEFDEVEDGTD